MTQGATLKRRQHHARQALSHPRNGRKALVSRNRDRFPNCSPRLSPGMQKEGETGDIRGSDTREIERKKNLGKRMGAAVGGATGGGVDGVPTCD